MHEIMFVPQNMRSDFGVRGQLFFLSSAVILSEQQRRVPNFGTSRATHANVSSCLAEFSHRHDVQTFWPIVLPMSYQLNSDSVGQQVVERAKPCGHSEEGSWISEQYPIGSKKDLDPQNTGAPKAQIRAEETMQTKQTKLKKQLIKGSISASAPALVIG